MDLGLVNAHHRHKVGAEFFCQRKLVHRGRVIENLDKGLDKPPSAEHALVETRAHYQEHCRLIHHGQEVHAYVGVYGHEHQVHLVTIALHAIAQSTDALLVPRVKAVFGAGIVRRVRLKRDVGAEKSPELLGLHCERLVEQRCRDLIS